VARAAWLSGEAIEAGAAAARRHPAFATARAAFSADVQQLWREDSLRRRLVNDFGSMALAVAVTAMHRLEPDGAQQARLIRAAATAGAGSPWRVRAYLDRLERYGAISRTPHPADARRIRIAPTAQLLATQRCWVEALFRAVALVAAVPALPEAEAARLALTEHYLAGIMQRHLIGLTVMDGLVEIAALMHRRHGYLLLLMLLDRHDGVADINRTTLAAGWDVSPAHVAAMLADAERAGCLARAPRASAVSLAPAFAAQLDLWFARELAVAALWQQAGAPGGHRPTPAGPAATARLVSQVSGLE
jgi:hypothetical protein